MKASLRRLQLQGLQVGVREGVGVGGCPSQARPGIRPAAPPSFMQAACDPARKR